MSVYQEHGYNDRNDYLSSAAEEYGVDPYVVSCLADLLGENEDFDGLINGLEDYSCFEGRLV